VQLFQVLVQLSRPKLRRFFSACLEAVYFDEDIWLYETRDIDQGLQQSTKAKWRPNQPGFAAIYKQSTSLHTCEYTHFMKCDQAASPGWLSAGISRNCCQTASTWAAARD
jgi:hypothetical protein